MKAPTRFFALLFSLALSATAIAAEKSAPKKAAEPAAMKYISTDDAPKAIGPYSQAVVEGGFLFAAGQIPLDPKSGELVGGRNRAVHRAGLRQPRGGPESRGADLLRRRQDDGLPDEGRGLRGAERRLRATDGGHKPARSTVIVAALPKNAPMEIELVARVRK